MAVSDAVLFLAMYTAVTVVCISDKSLTFEGWMTPDSRNIILQIVELPVYRPNSRHITKDRMFLASAMIADDAVIGAGLQPISCDALGTISGKRYAFLRDGCGKGDILEGNVGFTTNGLTSISPHFRLSDLPPDLPIQLECTFELCQSKCNGHSCKLGRGRSRRQSLVEVRKRNTVSVSSNILVVEGVQQALDSGRMSNILNIDKAGTPVLSWIGSKPLDDHNPNIQRPNVDEGDSFPDARVWIPVVLLTLLIIATVVSTATAFFRRKSALVYELERTPSESGLRFCTDYDCDGQCMKTCKMHECNTFCSQPCKLKISNNLTRFISRYPQRKLLRHNRCDSNCKSMCRSRKCSLGFKKTCNICGIDCNASCRVNTALHHDPDKSRLDGIRTSKSSECCRKCKADTESQTDNVIEWTRSAGDVRNCIGVASDVCATRIESNDTTTGTGRLPVVYEHVDNCTV